MGLDDKIQLFEDKRIRTAWDEEKEEWYFSIVDVVAVLTDAPDYQAARNYWKVTKKRLVDEGFEPVTSCNQLKMTAADGKKLPARSSRAASWHSCQSSPEPSGVSSQ